MTISVTGVFNTGSDPTWSGTTATSGSFTPLDNSLLFLVFSSQLFSGTLNPSAWTCSGGSLSWSSSPVISNVNVQGIFSTAISGFTAPVGTGASMTATISGLPTGSSATTYCFQAFSISSYNTSTNLGANGYGSNTSNGAFSISLSTLPAITSAVIAGTAWQPASSGGVTSNGAGWTQLYDVSAPGNGTLCTESQYIIGLSSTTVPWANQTGSDGISGTAPTQWALEFLAAGAGVIAGAPMITIGVGGNFIIGY